jgi:hypothetical protein
MITGWTGSRRSSLAPDGSPRNPYHMALTLEWADTRLPGIFRLVELLLRFLAKRTRRKGIEKSWRRGTARETTNEGYTLNEHRSGGWHVGGRGAGGCRAVSVRKARTEIGQHERQVQMMNIAIEKATRASKTITVNGATVLAGLLLALDRAAREAEEDAAIDAEDILAQAEEVNALDPVG